MNATSHPMLPPIGLANFLSCAWTLLFIAVVCVLALRFPVWFILCPSSESGKKVRLLSAGKLNAANAMSLSITLFSAWMCASDLSRSRCLPACVLLRPVNAHVWMFFAMCYTTGQWWKATMRVEIKAKWKKDASKWNESGNTWERGEGEAVREERVGRRHERSEEREKRTMDLEKAIEAECVWMHVCLCLTNLGHKLIVHPGTSLALAV